MTDLLRACSHSRKGFIGAARGRTKFYRYYTCWTRARYGSAACSADRLNADAADRALLANLAAFCRNHGDLITAAGRGIAGLSGQASRHERVAGGADAAGARSVPAAFARHR